MLSVPTGEQKAICGFVVIFHMTNRRTRSYQRLASVKIPKERFLKASMNDCLGDLVPESDFLGSLHGFFWCLLARWTCVCFILQLPQCCAEYNQKPAESFLHFVFCIEKTCTGNLPQSLLPLLMILICCQWTRSSENLLLKNLLNQVWRLKTHFGFSIHECLAFAFDNTGTHQLVA